MASTSSPSTVSLRPSLGSDNRREVRSWGGRSVVPQERSSGLPPAPSSNGSPQEMQNEANGKFAALHQGQGWVVSSRSLGGIWVPSYHDAQGTSAIKPLPRRPGVPW